MVTLCSTRESAAMLSTTRDRVKALLGTYDAVVISGHAEDRPAWLYSRVVACLTAQKIPEAKGEPRELYTVHECARLLHLKARYARGILGDATAQMGAPRPGGMSKLYSWGQLMAAMEAIRSRRIIPSARHLQGVKLGVSITPARHVHALSG